MVKDDQGPAPSLFIPSFFDEREAANPRRLVSAADAPAGTPPLGIIESLMHGGHVRPIVTRGSMHKRFSLPSVKTGMSELGEGKGEQLLAMTCEVDPAVSNYKCHPYRFYLIMDGEPFTYRPDIVIVHQSGLIEIVEVKRTPADLDADLKRKLAVVREFCRRCGWRFTIMFLDEIIGSKHRTHNVERLCGSRSLKLDVREALRADTIRLAGRPISFGKAAANLSPKNHRRGVAIIEHLITAGYFSINLDDRWDGDTILIPLRSKAQLPIPGFAIGR